MKKFHFRYQSLKKIRSDKERQALRTLAEAQQLLADEHRKKHELLQSLDQAFKMREGMGNGSVRFNRDTFYLSDQWIEGQKVRIEWADRAIERAQKRVHHALTNYLDIKRQLKTVERIEESDRENFQQERRQFEAKQLDELYVTRHGRNPYE